MAGSIIMSATPKVLFVIMVIVSFVSFGPAFGEHSDNAIVDIPDGVGLCTDENVECYTPGTITISEGATVTWSNSDDSTPIHTITSGVIADDDAGSAFDSAFISNGDTFEHTFSEVGEHPYFCQLHPRMSGLVIVEEAHGMDDKDAMHDDEDMMSGEQDMMYGEKDMMGGDKDMMMDSDGHFMMLINDEVKAKIKTTGDAIAGSPLEIKLKFTDMDDNHIEHVNYDVLVTQGTTRVMSEKGAHVHEGYSIITTRSLATSDPVNVSVTLQGIGLPGTTLAERTGPIGDMVKFTQVPEFGTIAVLVLVAAIVSIVAVSTRSNIFPRI